ncbi:glycoside hydrolase family 3 N-terminal domain-containing protein [Spongiactinospora sp. TRM90649]|uniref:glycoside hydrolase family 3 protein n=1 Tax=Spongiactinospora sp. TRM90649 TaxID=3031114 RepID=UPI0023F84673|nr:glycoside hydrolase family 3 N-terminal domain-containing protein [Spongiactinospora sp. TRM90649]MDF5754031.1 glycoside hydrolase family 3 N-terminal domain-containing protein [Spongiactinospora sp. TRM90649]
MTIDTARDVASADLARLADCVLQPGFTGTTAPDWIRRRLSLGLGGVTLFSRNITGPEQLATLTASLRAENPHVVIATDEEAGDVTRLEVRAGSSRPGNLALGAVDDPDLTEAVARDVGAALAQAGITLNYAPVADVNSADNPVVGTRAFGDDPWLVARHTRAWVTGLQAAGVAACAKHFPGHGATTVDSHDDLPAVTATAGELARVALSPFRTAIRAGVRSIMTGHLLVPALDPHWPATMSSRILTDLLRGELGFEGLIVTDGIEMPSLSLRYGLGMVAVRALAAGADVICVGGENTSPGLVDMLRNAIVAAVRDGSLSEERLTDAATRVRTLAAWASGPCGPIPVAQAGIGLAAARRAVRVTSKEHAGPLPLEVPPHVIELDSVTNLAVDRATGWGVAAPLAALLPGTTAVRLDPGQAGLLGFEIAFALGRPLVVACRDASRHGWVAAAIETVLSHRPDAIIVEMGRPGPGTPGAHHVATFGSSLACGTAAAEVISGRSE